MSDANNMAAAFEAEAGTAPVVNVSGVDAPTVETGLENEPVKTPKFYTEDDLAKVRSQEKDKLYPELERLKDEVLNLKKEKEEKASLKAAKFAEEEAAKAAAERDKKFEDLEAKDLIKLTTDELREQLERERQERERAFALLERERQFADLQSFKQQVVEQERDNIIPQLVDFIQGNSREEIAESVERLKERSASILESAQSAMQNARKEMRGTSATLPASGPLETNTESRSLTAQDIASMSVNEYAKVRDKLMSDSARGRTRGILG
jgi:hypothetical protein